MKPKEFFNQLQHDRIVEAIQAAERKTSGEIRVFVSRREPHDPVAAAQAAFTRLRMNRTRERNGVLIFFAPRIRRFAVIGDAGVHARCGDEFWRKMAAEMSGHFKKAEFTEGIMHAVKKAGELLAEHFPRRADDKNELPDKIAGD